MMNNNKILTVSYGTFSCTLEGFEDSFGTMKAIAEYFRDLASDDRYFGAEPPQPDAEMLARIAQREVSRKVQAREHEGKIVLSALEDQREAAASPAPVQETAQPEAAPAQPITEHPAAEETDVQPEMAQEQAAPAADTPASVEISSAPITDLDVAPSTMSLSGMDLTAGDISTDLEAETESESAKTAEAEQAEENVDSFFAENADPVVEEDFEEEIEASAEPVPVESVEAPVRTGSQSIAEKLQRIRAVVAKTRKQDDSADAPETLEDAFEADEAPETSSNIMRDAVEDIEDALEADDAAERDRQEAGRSETDADADADARESYRNELSAMLDTVEEAEDDTGEAEEAEAPAEQSRPSVQVVKVKRKDLDAAIARGEIEEYDDGDDGDDVPDLDSLAPSKSDTSSLSEEAEQELARELAELEADIAGSAQDDAADLEEDAELEDEDTFATYDDDRAEDEDDVEAAAPAPQEEPAARGSRGRSQSFDESADRDMDRLLAEADHKMDEPESATRRNAFTHLRAAVAAKKADVAMGKPERDANQDDAYRSDLAEVVRPRRPGGAGARTPRPAESRPAPLKLVAEQRIDAGRPSNAGPVRPRRVSSITEKAPLRADDGSTFADYAEEMGATTLSQLLEAAASYLSFVEGREQFSRPQLMSKVRQAGTDGEFSREDGLRSFGQLLRAGKIEKIKGGRFTVSEDIGYRPDQRAAG